MNIAVFASGKGTNLQAIIDAVGRGEIKAKLALVVSDREDAYALVRAEKAGIKRLLVERKKMKDREDFEQEISRHLEKEKIDLIVLAGFMWLLSGKFVRRYPNKILNIHPALLPSFKGMHAHEDALTYGVKISGVTVHFVDPEEDHGPIIIQKAVDVYDTDTKETLGTRILEWEYKAFPKAIELFCNGRLHIDGRIVRIDGEVKL